MNVKMFEGSDRVFNECCNRAGILNTARQYRKWKRGIGAASKFRAEVQREFDKKEWESFAELNKIQPAKQKIS